MSNATKIILVDDHQIILDGLRVLFSSFENVEVAAMFKDSRHVMSYLQLHEVDVLVADLHMPHLSGIDLALQVRSVFPQLKIVLLTMAEDFVHIRDAVKVGVDGYILKRTNAQELEKALQTILAGKRYYSDEVVAELSQPTSLTSKSEPSSGLLQHLTRREVEILTLIAEELTTAEIANKLYISVPTVEFHRRSLMIKLNAKNSASLVKYAIKYGLV